MLKFTRNVLFHEFCGLIQLFQFYNFHNTWPQFIFQTGKYCYIVGLGLNCKFIDLLFKHSVVEFIRISSLVGFIVSYLQADRHTHLRTDRVEMILMSWPENQGIFFFFYISQTFQVNRISFMASHINAVL